MYSGLFPPHDTIGTQSSENSSSLQKFKNSVFWNQLHPIYQKIPSEYS